MPLLGKAVRHEWALDWDFLSVNHGSFGAAPRVVLAAQQDWQRQMEAQPGRFMRAVLPDALRHAADRLGAFIGADNTDIAFVDNATTGCNAVLRSLRLQPGDEILVLTHGYGAVRNTVRYVAERAGARMVEAEVPFPHPGADTIVANIAGALTKRTRLAVVEHITSGSALVLPLRRIVAACHDAGVPALVDGAHGPAQRALKRQGASFVWTPIPMVSFTSEFVALTTIPHTLVSSSSTATGILSRPSASGNPAIRCSTPSTISRSAAMARFTWPKHEPSGSSSSAR